MPAPTVAADAEWSEYAALLRDDFSSFAAYCFRELNPRGQQPASPEPLSVMAKRLGLLRPLY